MLRAITLCCLLTVADPQAGFHSAPPPTPPVAPPAPPRPTRLPTGSPSPDEPTSAFIVPKSSHEDIAVGMRVKRGRDWRWGNQDGGPGSLGLVILLREWRGARANTGKIAAAKGPPGGATAAMEARRTASAGTAGSIAGSTADRVGGATAGSPGAAVHGARATGAAPTGAGAHAATDALDVNAKAAPELGVRVYWAETKRANNYRFGAGGAFDVEIVDRKIHPIDWKNVQLTPKVTALNASAEDVAVLRSLYDAAGGPHWRSSWDLRKNPCGDVAQGGGAWHGVTCRGDRVIAIELSNNGLTGRLPVDMLGKLGALETLSINNNRGLSGDIPSRGLARATSLRWLSLHSNGLGGTLPEDVVRLSNLEWLSLYGNRVEGTIPVGLGDTALLPNLAFLHLQQNRLSGTIPPALFTRTPKLRRFDFFMNELRDSTASTTTRTATRRTGGTDGGRREGGAVGGRKVGGAAGGGRSGIGGGDSSNARRGSHEEL